MTNVHRDNNHRYHIKEHPERIAKCSRHLLINRCDGLVDKGKFEQMGNDKHKDQHAGVGHGVGSDCPSAGVFKNFVTRGAGFQVFKKENNADDNVNQSQRRQPDIKNAQIRLQRMQFGRISIECVCSGKCHQVPEQVHG